MSDHPRPTRLSRLLARCYPSELREQYADDIARFIDDARRDPRNRNNPFGGIAVAASLSRDALLSLFASWRNDAPRPLRKRTPEISLTRRFRSFSMEALLQDIRFALRGFVRRPGFTAIALITLALGIGGNSAVFTLVNAVLLESLPYPNPEELVNISAANETSNRLMMSVPDVEDLRAQNRTFQDIGITRTQSVNLTGGDRPDRVIGNFVSASSLKLLGATTALGRIFTEEETKLGAGEQVVVLTHDTWQVRYGGRADIIGQTLILNGRPHVVIGVTAPKFRDPMTCDIWLPITSAPSRGWFERANSVVWAIGRLKPGVTLADGQKDLAAIAKRLDGASTTRSNNTISVQDVRESMVGGSRFMLTVLFGAVAVVLLIACVNIANLQLVRASTRQREMSIRAAMGANRTRLISQSITESLLLALVGGALGLAVGQVAVKFLVQILPLNVPVIGTLQPDLRVLLFSLATALVTGLLFGAPAAFSGTRSNLQGALRVRNEQASTRRFNLRNVLVVSELALCIVLLVVAGLFTRSLQSLERIDSGFHGEQVLTAEFRLPIVKYNDSLKTRLFMRSALERLRSTPGVTQAALIDAVPLSGNFGTRQFIGQGHADVPAGTAPTALYTSTTDHYFRTLEIPLLAGRDFNANDVLGSERVVIVNKTLADKTWPGENAVGKTVRFQDDGQTVARVVGVVGPIKQFTLSEETQPQIFGVKDQDGGIFTSVVIRTVGEPDAMTNALKAAIWSVDPDQPIWKIRSLQWLVDRDLSSARFSVGIISGFALLALLLATIGVYGVMSFAVQQRTREMGIRMALGARASQVLKLVMRSGLEVVTVSLVIGVGGAMAAGKFVQSRLYNVGAADPATMIGVPLLLGAVAMLACWLPARRAARVDPAVTLRSE